jgi:hydrogenase nickel incorporation protein HypA/HybF
MHELSIALSILDAVAEQLESHSYAYTRVASVRLKLGPLSGVVKEALEAAYELAREDSVAPDSRLVIDETTILGRCPTCADERPVASPQMLCCAVCGTPIERVTAGNELEIISLELET